MLIDNISVGLRNQICRIAAICQQSCRHMPTRFLTYANKVPDICQQSYRHMSATLLTTAGNRTELIVRTDESQNCDYLIYLFYVFKQYALPVRCRYRLLKNLIVSVLTNRCLIVAIIFILQQYGKVKVLKTDFFMCVIKFFFQNICKYPKKNLILQPIIINLLIII